MALPDWHDSPCLPAVTTRSATDGLAPHEISCMPPTFISTAPCGAGRIYRRAGRAIAAGNPPGAGKPGGDLPRRTGRFSVRSPAICSTPTVATSTPLCRPPRNCSGSNRAGIPVYLILGNHDSQGEMTRQVPWPANVTLLDHRRPQTVRHPSLPVAIHGMSYARREVTKNLVPDYPPPRRRLFQHRPVAHQRRGQSQPRQLCSLPGRRAGRQRLRLLGPGPCSRTSGAAPAAVRRLFGQYPRPARARAGAKGCVLVTVEDGELTSLNFAKPTCCAGIAKPSRSSPTTTSTRCSTARRSRLNGSPSAAAGRLAAVRLGTTAAPLLHQRLMQDATRQQIVADIRGRAADLADDLWIEKIKFNTRSLLDVDACARGKTSSATCCAI